jgi:glycosyltransferase involved in cell wall biosynthesis
LSDSACHRIWHWAELGFDRDVAEAWAGKVPCIYGCEHASLASFRRQRAAGGINLQWQVIAHQRTSEAILREEAGLFPAATTAYSELTFESAQEIAARKEEELELADFVICNSEFARRSFLAAGLAADKVVAVPTGCPRVTTDAESRVRTAQPHVFLYAGTLSLRKGVHYLLQAWRKANPRPPAELWLVGRSELPAGFFADLPDNVKLLGAVSRPELQRLFVRAGVLAFPTLCEGRARVVLEAAAAGLALLTTANSGCEDMVENGANGWLVEPRSVEALADRITWFLDHRDALPGMWSSSLSKAGTWREQDFAVQHARVVRELLARKGIGVAPRSA